MSIFNFKRIVSGAALAVGALFFASSAQATIVDLINGNGPGTINGAMFEWTDSASTGTGIITPFLRVQADETEQGYNTSNVAPPFDDKTGVFTHNITFADLMTTEVTIGGQNYFKILLDVNQSGNGNATFISLDQLQFYTSPTGSQNTTNLSLLGTLRYTFNVDGSDKVLLDASRNSGSGQGDMFAFIPVSAFAGTALTDFVYLYCHFGNTYATNDGFEEWSLVVNPIPEVSAFFPIVGLLAAVFSTQFVRRRQLQRLSK
jgi:hypothetical protein